MNLQPLYDVKERLEYAAIAGVSLLGEDFRLQRAAEGMKPLAAASPVFGKIDAGLTKLLSAPPEQRSGLLLDVLALVDAVAYTQAKTGAEGELEPLPSGGGVYHQITYGQITPLMTALTTTGGGRMETIKSAWENHPEFFEDYRMLPAVIAGLGDSYGEIAELNTTLLKKLGPSVVPSLKKGFDPAGKREMARRVEVIAALEGENASPWLRELLPSAKKDVRAAVITALGGDGDNTALLLDLAKSERGRNRDAALSALAKQDGDEVQVFWEKELEENAGAVQFLNKACSGWTSDLVARGLWDRLETVLEQGGRVEKDTREELSRWCAAALGKSSPSMLDFWRWADGKMEDIDQLKNHTGQPLYFGRELLDQLLSSVCYAGPGPLCDLCLELWGKHRDQTRYLTHAVVASLLTRSAAEVYDQFSPYVPTIKPLLNGAQKQAFHNAALRGLGRTVRNPDTGAYLIDSTWPDVAWRTAQPLDKRWIKRLTHSAWKTPEGGGDAYFHGTLGGFDTILMKLVDDSDPEIRKELVPYLRDRMREVGNYQIYSRWLFALGGSPKGVLKSSMLRNGSTAYLYEIWGLLNDASKALTTSETADLCLEVLDADRVRKEDAPLARRALPWTAEQLRAGKGFPEWDDWRKMR